MTVDALNIGDDNAWNLVEWLRSEAAADLQRNLEERILKFLFSQSANEPHFQKTLEKLAWIGSNPEDRLLLTKEILELSPLPGSVVQCRRIGKTLWQKTCKISRFIVNHKMEILAGAALCATGIGIAAVTGYSLSVAAGGIVVSGAGSIFHSRDKPTSNTPRIPPPCSKEEHQYGI